ncbi:MAG: hypothetical protein K6U07_05020, partial [Firmicutes bacterium]|nr:hypothetical protein [Bacillota bacterium]
SCLVLAHEVEGHEVTTVEGLATDGQLHPVQQAFVESGALQCGYCTPAMVLVTKALLDRVPEPSGEQVREAVAGVFCRCTGYVKILEAVQAAARRLREARA